MKKSMAWVTANVVLPKTLPRTIADRPTGATSTPCRKPAWRSSMIEIVAKIAVNKTISTIVPGNAYSR